MSPCASIASHLTISLLNQKAGRYDNDTCKKVVVPFAGYARMGKTRGKAGDEPTLNWEWTRFPFHDYLTIIKNLCSTGKNGALNGKIGHPVWKRQIINKPNRNTLHDGNKANGSMFFIRLELRFLFSVHRWGCRITCEHAGEWELSEHFLWLATLFSVFSPFTKSPVSWQKEIIPDLLRICKL